MASERLHLPAIPLPSGVEKFDRRRLAKRALENTAVELYREGVITAGYAAKILRLTRRRFFDLLASRRITIPGLTEAELRRQVEAVREFEVEGGSTKA